MLKQLKLLTLHGIYKSVYDSDCIVQVNLQPSKHHFRLGQLTNWTWKQSDCIEV